MIEMIVKRILLRIFHFDEMLLLLSLSALACLPIALSHVIDDPSLNLLPVTLIGTYLAWLLGRSSMRVSSWRIILFFFGPLILFLHIGQLFGPLLELGKQFIQIFSALYQWKRFNLPVDVSLLLNADRQFVIQFLTLGNRFFIWLGGLLQKTQVDDPLAHTLAWSFGLWLLAIWA